MKKILLVFSVLALGGCTAVGKNLSDVRVEDEQKLTAGVVQKEIKVGMSGAQVVEALGSPNIVSTDENNLEVWVYDKVSTENIQSSSSAGVGLLIFGASSASGASSSSQRTFTVIVKFDGQNKVRDLAYHLSRF